MVTGNDIGHLVRYYNNGWHVGTLVAIEKPAKQKTRLPKSANGFNYSITKILLNLYTSS